jgi:hypothetical protein
MGRVTSPGGIGNPAPIFLKGNQMRKKLPVFSQRTSSRLLSILLQRAVRDMRYQGLTDRAIARRLEIPRWMVRTIS